MNNHEEENAAARLLWSKSYLRDKRPPASTSVTIQSVFPNKVMLYKGCLTECNMFFPNKVLLSWATYPSAKVLPQQGPVLHGLPPRVQYVLPQHTVELRQN